MKKQAWVKVLLVIIALAALAACIYCGWYILQYVRGGNLYDNLRGLGPGDNEIDVNRESIQIPVDFEALQELNPDIYAWISVPGTPISYPVLQREGDNTYYLRRNSEGQYYSGGCIFSEDYNTKSFKDKLTVLYGHNMRNGSMFAYVNDFADAKVFEEHRQMIVYLPDKALVYQIFAAEPHSSEHLLINDDINDPEVFDAFYDEVLNNASLKANVLDGVSIDKTDKVLVLSTCFRDTNTQRYLLFGKLVCEIPAA